MSPPTAREAILRQHACRALMVALVVVRLGEAVHRCSGWLLDRLTDLAGRQRRHASDLAVLGGQEPIPERLRR